MKHSVKVMTTCLALVCSIFFFDSNVMGRSSFEHGSGDPPYGLAIQSNARGAKLYGELFLEHYDYLQDSITGIKSAEILRVVVRLRKGDLIKTYFADLDCSYEPLQDACTEGRYDTLKDGIIQQAIISKMKDQVLLDFFGGKSLTITLKNIEEYGIVFNTETPTSAMSLSDIELAVK